MDIVVLAGGLSPERDVSLSSGCLIANALKSKGHRVLLVDVYLGLEKTETFEQALQQYGKQEYTYTVPEQEPDLKKLQEETGRADLIGNNVLLICKSADITFLALHGAMGENGQIQAILEAYSIRYTGTGYVGSLLAMNKVVSKELMEFNGVGTPEWVVASADVKIEIPFLPCVIKPVSCGSSIGVSVVEDKAAFAIAWSYAQKYESEILIEKKIEGREFSVGILDGEALPIIEILPKEGFYDYKNKYQQGLITEVCPAKLDKESAEELQQAALKVHHILKLGSYSRVDFMMDAEGVLYCLEANTLPGMTPTSLLPQEVKANGVEYEELCEKLVMLAL